MTDETPTTDLLTALESYNESHLSASSSFKSSVWNLYKARRQKGRNAMTIASAYSAFDIREELRAQATLTCSLNKDEPLLGDEDLVNIRHGDVFALQIYDSKSKEDRIAAPKNVNDEIGIRHRKKGSDDKNQSKIGSLWKEENCYVEEETKLLKTDPLNFFGGGLAPRELKLAQKHAKESLNAYIAAASQAAAVLTITNRLAQSTIAKKD